MVAPYQLGLTEAQVAELKSGDRGKGTLAPGATDFLAFTGQSGQTMFLNVRSASFEPAVSVRGPDGVLLASAERNSSPAGSLLAIKLARAGRYVVWIGSYRGAGDYAVRLIDGN